MQSDNIVEERIEWELGGIIFYTRKPLVKDYDTQVWGYPLKHKELITEEWNDETLNAIPGYFVAIRKLADSILIVNDILGGYRLYYTKINERWYFSDDYHFLLNKLNRKPTVDKEQFEYWKNHRYTLSSGTIFKEIKKVTPASRIYIQGEKITFDSYFKDVCNRSCYKKLMDNGFSIIADQLQTVYQNNKESTFLLFYSGGADSTFLLKTLQKLEIPFECVLIRYSPRWSVSEKEYCEAIEKLKIFGVSDYTVLDVDLNKAFMNHVSTAEKEMLFDRHISVHFYETYKRVVETWGNNVVIVNGQSADSILSFGPSDLIPGFFVKRCILYSNWISNIVLEPFVRGYLNNRFRMPWSKKEKLRAMLDEWNYFFAIRRKCPYLALLNDVLNDKRIVRLNYFSSRRMYAKIISFLQGPDNQVVIQAANHFGINKIIMPFTAPDFIYNVVKYKSNIREIFQGKYFVRDYNKRVFRIKMPTSKVEYVKPYPDFDMRSYEANILAIYKEYINQIISR